MILGTGTNRYDSSIYVSASLLAIRIIKNPDCPPKEQMDHLATL
jgi:hypothetical protein